MALSFPHVQSYKALVDDVTHDICQFDNTNQRQIVPWLGAASAVVAVIIGFDLWTYGAPVERQLHIIARPLALSRQHLPTLMATKRPPKIPDLPNMEYVVDVDEKDVLLAAFQRRLQSGKAPATAAALTGAQPAPTLRRPMPGGGTVEVAPSQSKSAPRRPTAAAAAPASGPQRLDTSRLARPQRPGEEGLRRPVPRTPEPPAAAQAPAADPVPTPVLRRPTPPAEAPWVLDLPKKKKEPAKPPAEPPRERPVLKERPKLKPLPDPVVDAAPAPAQVQAPAPKPDAPSAPATTQLAEPPLRAQPAVPPPTPPAEAPAAVAGPESKSDPPALRAPQRPTAVVPAEPKAADQLAAAQAALKPPPRRPTPPQ